MFIHLGGDTLVSTQNIIVILNNEINSKNNIIEDFIKKNQEKKEIKRLEGEKYKSIVITDKKIYISPISSMTLKKRAEYIDKLT